MGGLEMSFLVLHIEISQVLKSLYEEAGSILCPVSPLISSRHCDVAYAAEHADVGCAVLGITTPYCSLSPLNIR